jgi:hypothetical protein
MTPDEYYYFEWLIIAKNMTPEIYSSLNDKEIHNLINEYKVFKQKHEM